MFCMACEVSQGNLCHAIMSGHPKMRDRKSSVELYPWTVGTIFGTFSVDSLLRVDPTLFFIVVLASQLGAGEGISTYRYVLTARTCRSLSASPVLL